MEVILFKERERVHFTIVVDGKSDRHSTSLFHHGVSTIKMKVIYQTIKKSIYQQSLCFVDKLKNNRNDADKDGNNKGI